MTLFVTDTTLLTNLNNLAEYSDLSAAWYLDIGYQIWFNWVILGLVHFAMPAVHCLLECIN